MLFKKEVIGKNYLTRWHIIPRNPYFNIYLHKFTGDDQRLPHCHPWANLSVLLKGKVRERYISDDYAHVPDKYKHMAFCQSVRLLAPGNVVYRPATFTHRLEVVDGPVWTLFLTLRRYRPWGFYGPKGFVHWREAIGEDGLLKKEILK